MPPEPTPPKQWPIDNYWRESNKRISQHWYISFCLMMSALQDYLTGLVLQEKNNLSWATTCYYYSMVHTGRLLAFCTIGDYPTRHIDLRNLYRNRPVRATWLNRFIEGGLAQTDSVRIDRDALVAAPRGLFDELGTSSNLDVRIRSFSRKLDCLAELRTDSNYEPLLIAHEKHHVLVTESFERLVTAASSAASEATSLAVGAYTAYVNASHLLNGHRDSFKLLSNRYVRDRLYMCLLEKIGPNNEAKEKLKSLCKSLRFKIRATAKQLEQAEQIEEQINLEQFESKQSLMNEFRNKIRNLEYVTRVTAEE